MTCVVDVSPQLVDAGAEMTLHGTVSCTPARDLRGHTLLIKDDAGAGVGSIEIAHFDGETNETDEFVAKAPAKAGAYMWSAVYEENSTPISFSVKPHTTSVVVWDVPSSVVIGEKLRIKVGIKCSSECRLRGKDFAIYDHEGTRIVTVSLSGDRWPGTSLYSAEVELETPSAQSLYTWSVKCPGSDAEMPHGEGATSFGVRVVSRPEYVVMVETVDKVSQTPLSGARVVMHPYRAVTEERGVAGQSRMSPRIHVTRTHPLADLEQGPDRGIAAGGNSPAEKTGRHGCRQRRRGLRGTRRRFTRFQLFFRDKAELDDLFGKTDSPPLVVAHTQIIRRGQ